MKIMGRVARLMWVGFVSVCFLFCFLCCLQNNPVFLSVSYLIISKNENYELCISAGFFVMTGKKSSSRLSGGLCCCVSFRFWRLRPEKKSSSRLSGGLCCCVSFWFWRLQPEKKIPVVCLAKLCCCISFWFWREIGSFLMWRESFITTGKKVLVVCLAGCAVVLVFGSGDYNRKKKF